jgi:hypothetical protein
LPENFTAGGYGARVVAASFDSGVLAPLWVWLELVSASRVAGAAAPVVVAGVVGCSVGVVGNPDSTFASRVVARVALWVVALPDPEPSLPLPLLGELAVVPRTGSGAVVGASVPVVGTDPVVPVPGVVESVGVVVSGFDYPTSVGSITATT